MGWRFIALFIVGLSVLAAVWGGTAVLSHAAFGESDQYPVPGTHCSLSTDNCSLTPSAFPFIQNVGQFAEPVLFQLRDSQTIYWFTADSIWLTLYNDPPQQGVHLQWLFPGSNPAPTVEPFDAAGNVISYFGPTGAYPSVPVWGGIRYVNLYDGVDLVLRVENGRFQPTFIAHKTADLSTIHLQLNGADELVLQGNELIAKTAVGNWPLPLPALPSPFTFHASRFTLHVSLLPPRPFFLPPSLLSPPSSPLAPSSPPTLTYSTLLGGTFPDEGEGIVVDEAGNAFTTGYTQSPSFPTDTVPFNPQHGIDVYIAKFAPDGKTADYIIWINALNALYEDQGYALAINNQGEAFVTGQTRSPEFCLFFGTIPGYDPTYNLNSDAFALKVSADGTTIDYCTFLGGDDWDIGRAIAVDNQNNAYITGGTWSTNLTTTPNAYDPSQNGARDGYLVKLDPTGTQLLYATYLGGENQEEVRGIAVDEASYIHLAGWTNSADFPATPDAYEPTYQGEFDAFLFTFAPNGQRHYATYLGGSGEDRAMNLAISADSYTYVQGYTTSADFYTTTTAYDPTYNGGYDTFLLKLNPAGNNLAFATYLGGSSNDEGYGLAVDVVGAAYLVGQTDSTDFPTTTLAFSPHLNGGRDAFVAQLDPTGSTLLYGSYLGGSDTDRANAIAATYQGEAYTTGTTVSPNFPVTPGAYDTTPNGDYDAFITKLAVAETAESLQAAFTAHPTIGPAPLLISFTNTSAGDYQTSLWEFGDGAASTLTNPVHLYTTPGSYTITLTISGTLGIDIETKIGYITVSEHKLYLPFIGYQVLDINQLSNIHSLISPPIP